MSSAAREFDFTRSLPDATQRVSGASGASNDLRDYQAFLAGKRPRSLASGITVPLDEIHPWLFPFQRRIVQWGLARGRAAVFAHTGLGKTGCQCEWAKHVYQHTGQDVLILAPLAVSHQTVREAEKIDLTVTLCRRQSDVKPGINITNYEMLSWFNPEAFGGLVIDESSCLKSYEGVVRKQITAFGSHIPFRLACTATPAPNDWVELTNHAEFLGVMEQKEVLALFFTQQDGLSHKWRLKGHARQEFWRWLSSWAVAVRSPADLGYSDAEFILPPLSVHQVTVPFDSPIPGRLFMDEAQGMDEVRLVMRQSLPARVEACAALVNGNDEPWLVWCNTNDESAALAKAIPEAIEVRGSDPIERKETALLDFAEGRSRVLVTKASIAGHGMNFQRCARIAFVGLNWSFELYFQAIRRCWRFGQKRPVECYVIASEAEGAVARAIERKEAQAEEMMSELVSHMRGLQLNVQGRDESAYEEDETQGKRFRMLLGDNIQRVDEIASDSIGLILTSVPFPGMYCYSATERDMGNVKDIEEMLAHFRFLIGEDKLLRVLMPGRSFCIHLTQSVAFKHKDGYIGLKDFRGAVIQTMIDAGWTFYGEVTIEKNPQMKAVRTKDRGLLFKTLATDSSHMHMALADYMLQFRKPGDNPAPIRAGVSKKYGNEEGWITPEEWIEWASPVWRRHTSEDPDGIRETDVLNVAQARETDDERHLCPLQLDVIERAVKLWTNPGETVLDPFMGIGSVGVGALKLNRQAVGIELKRSYWAQAVRNCRKAEQQSSHPTLFSALEDEEDTP